MAVLMLSGCDAALLNPKGAIGVQEKELIITAVVLMLIVVIPTILMTIYFSFKYRASNTDEEYAPEWSHSTKIELMVWIIPVIIIILLGTITWRTTHELEPSKPLVHDAEPVNIEVVALDWKWLFIYPEQHIATVNHVVFPKDVPVSFTITADKVMNSFFIPRLGGQMYAMPGMASRLHLIANHEGDFKGISSGFSGDGFSHMKFTATATADVDSFNQWVEKVKSSPDTLADLSAYKALAQPSIDAPVTYYSKVVPELFANIVTQYPGSMNASFDKACLVEDEG